MRWSRYFTSFSGSDYVVSLFSFPPFLTLSSFPFETGSEKRSLTSMNAFDHSAEVGAWNNRHQTDL